jgi:hypothetical protein
MATQARIAPSLACAAAIISGIPARAQQEQAPLILPEHVQKTLDCMDALMKQPAIADLLVTLGVGQFTPNGKMAMPTPVRIFSNNYAMPRDSGSAIAFVVPGSRAELYVATTEPQRFGALAFGEVYKRLEEHPQPAS